MALSFFTVSALRPILVEIFNKIKTKATDGSSIHVEQGIAAPSIIILIKFFSSKFEIVSQKSAGMTYKKLTI